MPFYAAIIARIFGKQVIYHVHEKMVNKRPIDYIAEFVFNHVRSKRIYVSNYLASLFNNEDCDYVIEYNKLSRDFINRSSFSLNISY